jgi:DtxR family Mn-dependent transcriptional regulator
MASDITQDYSSAIQDYLKTIYQLQQDQQRVMTSAIADALAREPASVTGMIQKLAQNDLLHYERHRGVRLTPAGEKIALEVIRHHRLIELFLTQALGYRWDEVHAEADRLEHVISEEFEDRIAAALGNPQFDPHGDPIPTKEGTLPAADEGERLADLEIGRRAVIQRIGEQSAEMLRYLAGLGLVPQTIVVVRERAPLGGPLLVEIAGGVHAIGRDVAQTVLVAPVPE